MRPALHRAAASVIFTLYLALALAVPIPAHAADGPYGVIVTNCAGHVTRYQAMGEQAALQQWTRWSVAMWRGGAKVAKIGFTQGPADYWHRVAYVASPACNQPIAADLHGYGPATATDQLSVHFPTIVDCVDHLYVPTPSGARALAWYSSAAGQNARGAWPWRQLWWAYRWNGPDPHEGIYPIYVHTGTGCSTNGT